MWKKTGNRPPALVCMERHARKTKTPELYKHHCRQTAKKATHGDGSEQPRPKPTSLFRVLLDKERDMRGWIYSPRQMCHKYWCKTAAEQVTAVNQHMYKWIELTRQNDKCHQKPLAVFISKNNDNNNLASKGRQLKISDSSIYPTRYYPSRNMDGQCLLWFHSPD